MRTKREILLDKIIADFRKEVENIGDRQLYKDNLDEGEGYISISFDYNLKDYEEYVKKEYRDERINNLLEEKKEDDFFKDI